eukprot:1928297-Pyramimonas_sp.AAC.1
MGPGLVMFRFKTSITHYRKGGVYFVCLFHAQLGPPIICRVLQGVGGGVSHLLCMCCWSLVALGRSGGGQAFPMCLVRWPATFA